MLCEAGFLGSWLRACLWCVVEEAKGCRVSRTEEGKEVVDRAGRGGGGMILNFRWAHSHTRSPLGDVFEGRSSCGGCRFKTQDRAAVGNSGTGNLRAVLRWARSWCAWVEQAGERTPVPVMSSPCRVTGGRDGGGVWESTRAQTGNNPLTKIKTKIPAAVYFAAGPSTQAPQRCREACGGERDRGTWKRGRGKLRDQQWPNRGLTWV